MAVTKPVSSAPGVDGVLATQVAPVAASAKVMSVKVPPTSMAMVPGMLGREARAMEGCHGGHCRVNRHGGKRRR